MIESPPTADSISTRIVRSVATEKECEPENLDPPLYESVDPDALDALFRADSDDCSEGVRVVFTYCGYEVAVSSDGVVDVTNHAESAERADPRPVNSSVGHGT